jgi:hypothetical protein
MGFEIATTRTGILGLLDFTTNSIYDSIKQPLELWMFLVKRLWIRRTVKILDGTLVVTYQQTKELCLFDEILQVKKTWSKYRCLLKARFILLGINLEDLLF